MDNQEFKKMLIKRALKLARDTMKFVDKFPNKISARVIADQLLRAVTSVGANIIEAQAASSRKDFVNFLNHALKSGNETKFWLVLSGDLGTQITKEAKALLKETDELVKILGSSISTLRGKKKID